MKSIRTKKGKRYKITATPKPGWEFGRWVRESYSSIVLDNPHITSSQHDEVWTAHYVREQDPIARPPFKDRLESSKGDFFILSLYGSAAAYRGHGDNGMTSEDRYWSYWLAAKGGPENTDIPIHTNLLGFAIRKNSALSRDFNAIDFNLGGKTIQINKVTPSEKIGDYGVLNDFDLYFVSGNSWYIDVDHYPNGLTTEAKVADLRDPMVKLAVNSIPVFFAVAERGTLRADSRNQYIREILKVVNRYTVSLQYEGHHESYREFTPERGAMIAKSSTGESVDLFDLGRVPIVDLKGHSIFYDVEKMLISYEE